MFEEREAAAKWLCVPVESLLPKASGTARWQKEWCAEFVLGRLVETKGTPPRFGFTFSVLIIPINLSVMQRFITPAGLLVSQVSTDAASQLLNKSWLAFNRERCDFCR